MRFLFLFGGGGVFPLMYVWFLEYRKFKGKQNQQRKRWRWKSIMREHLLRWPMMKMVLTVLGLLQLSLNQWGIKGTVLVDSVIIKVFSDDSEYQVYLATHEEMKI